MLLGNLTPNWYLTPRDALLLASIFLTIRFSFLTFFAYRMAHFHMSLSIGLLLKAYLVIVTGSSFLIISIGYQFSSSYPSHEINILIFPFLVFSFDQRLSLIVSNFQRLTSSSSYLLNMLMRYWYSSHLCFPLDNSIQ